MQKATTKWRLLLLSEAEGQLHQEQSQQQQKQTQHGPVCRIVSQSAKTLSASGLTRRPLQSPPLSLPLSR